METERPSQAIGSDAWVGAEDYEPGSQLHVRATNFFQAINWEALLKIASQHRNGATCQLAENFSLGHFNMTRRIVFEDGASWVARLRLPTDDCPANRESLDDSKTMEIERAAMKFFRSRTQIPVPEVHAYSFAIDNEVGAAYILMDYIHGSVASELRAAQGSAVGLFGTIEQDRHFRQQMASIQAIVASFRFAQIGAIYHNEETDEFYVGPELQTGKGPWDSSAEYYNDLTHHLLKSASESDLAESQSFMVPSILNYLLRLSSRETTGPFRLVNRDFGPHNILVNQDFEITAVIDFDGLMAAPAEAVAQYPIHAFLDVEPPGIIDPRPAVVARVAQTAPRLQTYKEMLAKYLKDGETRDAGVADYLDSHSAGAYRGMVAYQQHQESVNNRWMGSCLKMLQEHVRNDIQQR